MALTKQSISERTRECLGFTIYQSFEVTVALIELI